MVDLVLGSVFSFFFLGTFSSFHASHAETEEGGVLSTLRRTATVGSWSPVNITAGGTPIRVLQVVQPRLCYIPGLLAHIPSGSFIIYKKRQDWPKLVLGI